MADKSPAPAQPEGASQPPKKKSTPVNLAMVEAAERGIDITPERLVKAAPPAPPTPEGDRDAPDPLPSDASTGITAPAVPSEPPADPPRVDLPTIVPQEKGSPAEALLALASVDSGKRLSPQDEDRATALLRACLSQGEISAALAAMPKLPWILGVRGIEQSWVELSRDTKTELLQALEALKNDHAIRLRLSVARSLSKIDPPVGLELAGAVCQAMWDGENGSLSPDHSKLIGNVFIGRGKPWVLQLGLDGMSGDAAQAVVSCVLFSVFNVNNPPITQLSVLRYAGAHLSKLHPNLLTLVSKGIGRWSGKWQDSLLKEVADLPEQLTGALKSGRGGKPPQESERELPPAESTDSSRENPRGESGEEAHHDEDEAALPQELEERLKLAVESGDAEAVETATQEINAWRDAHARYPAENSARRVNSGDAPEGERRPERTGRRDRDQRQRERKDRPDRPERGDRKERPVYVSREQEAASRGQGNFNLSATLKQIESHVSQLRSELANAQAKARKAELAPVRRPPADKVVLSIVETNLSPEELKRLVVQLEQRSGELQSRVEELLADSETRALATEADADVTGQFRALLKLKLQEDYSDYLALEKNLPEYVVQQHYRALIRHVFGVLRDEGVRLDGDLPSPPPPPLPPPPPPPEFEEEEEEEDSPLDKVEEEPETEGDHADDASAEIRGDYTQIEPVHEEPSSDQMNQDSKP